MPAVPPLGHIPQPSTVLRVMSYVPQPGRPAADTAKSFHRHLFCVFPFRDFRIIPWLNFLSAPPPLRDLALRFLRSPLANILGVRGSLIPIFCLTIFVAETPASFATGL
jgi:hypothetical protein